MTLNLGGNSLVARACAALLAIAFATGLAAGPSRADNSFGPYGPEGPRLREQFWLLPSGDPKAFLRATVFRPVDASPADAALRRPVVIINHGTSESTRLAVAMPVYYWLSRWFVERGYVVVLPQRRGHGATGGPLVEGTDTCANPDHFRSGLAAADDIGAVVSYMAGQPFVDPSEIVVTGISTGGWASLALASRNPAVRAVINIAGGRGGHAWGRPNEICGEQRLIQAARDYGATARIPTLWLYARNDSYFGPNLATSMAKVWRGGGGLVELSVLPAYGVEGHDISDDRAGWDVWGPAVVRFLAANQLPIEPHHERPAREEISSVATVATSAGTGPAEPAGGRD